VAEQRGLSARQVSGASGDWYYPEIMCGGGAWLDYDNDGDLDFYLVQAHRLPKRAESCPVNQLFRNDHGRFTEVPRAGGADDAGYGNGVACGDYDNDGYVDIYVNNVGPNALYHNNGDGTFTDVTEKAGVGDPRWCVSSGFLDYDGDGDLDLYVANYVQWSVETDHPCYGQGGRRDYCGPASYKLPERHTLYRNNGDGTFTDVTEQAGMGQARGNGLGVVAGDFNGDDLVDIYVTNDGSENFLWVNQGDGTFIEDALMMGCAVNELGKTEAGMGADAADYDDDGDLDLFMTHLSGETNTFYEFREGMFEDMTTRLGLAGPSTPYTGMGLGFFDYDNNGLLDIFIGNGRVTYGTVENPAGPFAEPNQLYRLSPDGRYTDVSAQAGSAVTKWDPAHAVAFGDYDNDGDTDIAIVNMDGPVRLLDNRVGADHGWIGICAKGKYGRYALGAVVTVVTDHAKRNRLVHRAYSYAASNDPRVLVGLGESAIVTDVIVKWPWGKTEHFGPQPAGRYVELIEGHGQPTAAQAAPAHAPPKIVGRRQSTRTP
jgi:hypothetical protein